MECIFTTVSSKKTLRKFIRDSLINIKRAKTPIKKQKRISKQLVVPASINKHTDQIKELSLRVKAKAEYLFYQNKKLIDDNKYMLSNIRKVKEEEFRRTKNIFESLFSLFYQSDRDSETVSTPLLSNCTFQTDVSDPEIIKKKIRLSESFSPCKSDSFRKILDTHSMMAVKSEGFRSPLNVDGSDSF